MAALKQMKTMYYSHSYIYTASKFDILDDFCVIKRFLQDHFDPVHDNQPCFKIRKSSKLFMHDCRIPMCASCVHCERCAFWKMHRAQLCSAHAQTQNAVNNHNKHGTSLPVEGETEYSNMWHLNCSKIIFSQIY